MTMTLRDEIGAEEYERFTRLARSWEWQVRMQQDYPILWGGQRSVPAFIREEFKTIPDSYIEAEDR